ncbi:hypothetical protein AtNW77_Chr5g0122221 [Arabidopsis thaliana]|uniref:Uncharacterized protein n=2 Tax=Arabidopsis thaliana TaxID=3702 RepID=A0A654G6P6_ARATH|nr:MADS-box family protein [Arabidopsis thaliana]AED94507.1 MADS-box family protein [Arabidopsis thaliana]VYS68789.1 unnamed protein product [Arabidopsis thaliana]|eukprot:NP_198823.1 MADS-box family protein [Arabidopsis thaliana]
MTMRSSLPSSSSSYSLASTSLSNRLETQEKRYSSWVQNKKKKKKNKGLKNPNKKRKTSLKKNKGLKNPKRKTSLNNVLKYPLADHYSPDQISQLIQSLEPHVSKTQSLNPSQFSLFMYNHGDNTLSQIPVTASNFNQDFSALLQESGLMKQELYGYD